MINYKEDEKTIDEYDLYIEKALLKSENKNLKYYTLEEFDREMRKILDE